MKPTSMRSKTRRSFERSRGRAYKGSVFSRAITSGPLNSYGVMLALLIVFVLTLLALATQPTVHASNPTSGSLTTASSQITWQGTALAGGAVGDPLLGIVAAEDLCIEGRTCDTFTLTIAGTPTEWATAQKLVHIHLGWTIPTQDFDLYVHRGDLNGPVVASSGNGATNQIFDREDADLDPSSPSIGTGTFAVHVVYYSATSAEQYTGTASVVSAPAPPPPGPTPTPTTEPPGTPRFFSYLAPPGVGDDAGEPSIGVNWNSEKTFAGIPNGGTVNYFGGFLPYMLRVSFNDALFPAKATWEKAPLTVATAPRVFGDPILFTDPHTGRTFVSQELGLSPGGSTMEWTDDDGRTFTPSTGSGAPSGIDHQTVGGGPYAQPVPTGVNPLYPNGVWYCSQSIVDAVCSISLDGGTTFGPAVPMYSLLDCGGIHGHIKIGPDGTAYVPNVACGDNQGLIVSEDNGISWSIRKLPQSLAADRDPSVAVGSDSTVYFSYQNADGHSHVAVSRDKGRTWINDNDIGAQLGIKNSLFHAAVAGDGDRAAVAFFGTTQGGADYSTPAFTGVWYLYIATTFDRGQTWFTQNATPNDPIQRGGICTTGTCRNLLDFFGAEVDKEGRILVGYDDGCISRACITGQKSYGIQSTNDFIAKAAISRQTGGKRMFAAYDPPAGPVQQPPSPPLPTAPGMSCDGLVATDPTGDAGNPEASSTGSPDQFDITGLAFTMSADRQSLVTSITLKNFSPVPPAATLGGFYRVVWTTPQRNSDGSPKYFATQVTTDPTGSFYEYGVYDPVEEKFIGSTTTATGTSTSGANGTLNVSVPLTALGNPTIPTTDATTLPAVIEPYALVFAHEEVVSFLSPVERAPDYGYFGSNWAVCIPIVTTVEDDSSNITYTQGWHHLNSPSASASHFALHTGKSRDQFAYLPFTVSSGRIGKLSYFYGTSTKGGSAEVVLDGVSRTVTYHGASGGTKDPVFGARIDFPNLAPGQHLLEIKSLNDAVYIDRFVLESSYAFGEPTSGPGSTTTNSTTLASGQEFVNSLPVSSNATAISLVAESNNNLPIQLLLISPSGSVLQTANSSGGMAVLEVPVSQGGNYLVKVINLNLGPVQVWTAATPTLRR